MKLNNWLEEHSDPHNILAPEMEVEDAMSILNTELFSDEWYVNYACTDKQALCEMVCTIVHLYKPSPIKKFFRKIYWKLFT